MGREGESHRGTRMTGMSWAGVEGLAMRGDWLMLAKAGDWPDDGERTEGR